ncbi:FGGY family carbohydrate kinase [Paenibacillus sp. 1P07SE]|uniref:FGGY family carbohydrate kinase n=1 Tax=Paenibacillus sp. 1P07SE TaxID=3132209 RepID=UPI0039A51C3D
MVRSRTGLLLDPYFSAGKISWILRHVPNLPPQSRLMAGTMDSWLVWKLTGGAAYVTDHTNASRTSLYNLQTKQWDEELKALFGLEGLELPRIISSTEIAGYPAASELPGAQRVPVCGLIGDSQGALYGQRCRQPGMAKVTYGTGSSVLAYTGKKPLSSSSGLVTAVAWAIGSEVHYALEGIIHSSGDTMKWLRDNLGLFDSFEEAVQLASGLHHNEGVYVVPAFAGLGAPYWDADARAAVVGLSRGATRAHLIRAGYESIAYQIRDAAELFADEAGIRLAKIQADGGASSSGYLMQLQADILQAELVCSDVAELSAMGSCYLGGLTAGVWRHEAELDTLSRQATRYLPGCSRAAADTGYAGWQQAVARVRSDRLLAQAK